MTMVTLRDGNQVPDSAVRSTMVAIQGLEKENVFALSDLVGICKDPNFVIVKSPLGDSGGILKKKALLDEDGKVRDIVKRIVLNSIEGEGVMMHVIDPRKKA